MRIGVTCLAAWACVLGLSGKPAPGEAFKIASFSDSRSFKYFIDETQDAEGQAFIEGYDWYSSIRETLITADFGVPATVTLNHEVSDARSELAGQGYDLLIMNEVTPLGGSAADDEAAAIAQFVFDGGCLIVIADPAYGGHGNVMGNQVLAALDGGSGAAGRYGPFVHTDSEFEASACGYFALDSGQTSNLVWGGGFTYQVDGTGETDPLATSQNDVLDNARFGVTDHVLVNPGSWSQVVGGRAISTGPSPMMMEILGSDIDAGLSQTGAGNVLVVGDTIFANDMVYPIPPIFQNPDPADNNNNRNNADIISNFIHQQVIPEPGGLVLLASLLTTVAAYWGWRRRPAGKR